MYMMAFLPVQHAIPNNGFHILINNSFHILPSDSL